MCGLEKGDSMGQVTFIGSLFGVAASAEQEAGRHVHRVPVSFCNTAPVFDTMCTVSTHTVVEEP